MSYRTARILSVLLGLLFLTQSCVKDEYVISENSSIPGLEPTLAIPLAFTELGLGELEQNLDIEEADVANASGDILTVSFTERLFEFGVEDLVDIPDQGVEDGFVADGITALILNVAPEGEEVEFILPFELPFDFENGEILDSIILGESNLNIEVSSSFRHDVSVNLSIEQLKIDGVGFSETVVLDYEGSVPIETDLSFDVSGGLLDFTGPGQENALFIDAEFTVTVSGETTNVGDSLGFTIGLSANSLNSAYGYLGQFTELADVDTQRVDIFESIDADRLFFADPSIDLFIQNSSGIALEVDFSSLIAPENEVASIITGGALEEIPVVDAAAFLGDIAYTSHTIDNTNTSPSLSDMLSEGPVELIYTAQGTTNPEGFQYNFIQDTSRITCDATVNLPLYGYVDGYRFLDTVDVDLEVDLGIGDVFSIDDIEQVTLRTIMDNGLPLEAGVQLIFLDSLGLAFDSLFSLPYERPIVPAGYVDHSLEPSDPLHGRVQEKTRRVTDVPMNNQRLRELLEGRTRQLVVEVRTSTADASESSLVKFFPEDGIDVQLSAKVETHIDLGE